MKTENVYNAEVELSKGADLTAVSYDPTQLAFVTGGKATVGGKKVTAEISGIATGKGVESTVNLWLSRFSYRKPDGTVLNVPDLNVPARLTPRQGAIDTAKRIASFINASKKPYRAKAAGTRTSATLSIAFAMR